MSVRRFAGSSFPVTVDSPARPGSASRIRAPLLDRLVGAVHFGIVAEVHRGHRRTGRRCRDEHLARRREVGEDLDTDLDVGDTMRVDHDIAPGSCCAGARVAAEARRTRR